MNQTCSYPPPEPAGQSEIGVSIVSDGRRRRRILVAASMALLAVMASATGLGVAQQALAIDLGASQATVIWIINAYTVVLAALLLPVGAVGDRWGRRPLLIVGLVVFGLASVAAGLADTSSFMIGARALAGVGAAMVMPVTLSVITSSFPEENRGQAIGVWTAVAGGGGLIGMFVSALLVDIANWRWIFALPVALIALALIVTVWSVPNSHERTPGSFDIGGSVLSMLAVGSVVLAIHQGPEIGWAHPLTAGALVVGLLSTFGFWVWEKRREYPLLDVAVFRDRRLASGSLALVVVFGVLGGVFIVLFPYFQAVLGWSGLQSTVGILPMAILMMASSALAPRPARRFGTKATMLTGVGLAAFGLGLMGWFVSVDGGYLSVFPGMLVIGVGVGLVMTPSTEAITLSLPSTRQGVASAINDTTREIGTALGVGLLGAALSAAYRTAIHGNLVGFSERTTNEAAEGIGSAFRMATELGAEEAAQLLEAAQRAFVEAWATSMWIGVIGMGALWVYILLRGPKGERAAD